MVVGCLGISGWQDELSGRLVVLSLEPLGALQCWGLAVSGGPALGHRGPLPWR